MKITDLTSNTRRLETSQFVHLPRPEVFAFFSDPRNLEEITPPWLRFRMTGQTTPTVGEGTELRYRLRVHGIPTTWISRITEWVPEERFVDLQLKGPYTYWRHLHIFEEADGGTVIRDQVDFQLPFGKFGSWLGSSLVESDILKIFRFRADRTYDLLRLPAESFLPGSTWVPSQPPDTWH